MEEREGEEVSIAHFISSFLHLSYDCRVWCVQMSSRISGPLNIGALLLSAEHTKTHQAGTSI